MPRLLPLAVTASAALVLSACGGSGDGSGAGSDSGKPVVVTSTNVYASIASAVAGDRAEVTPIIDDPAQDPHEYEATPQDQLTLSKADLVVMNGGGYDAYMSTMLDAIDGDPEVIDIVDLSGLPGSEDAEHSHDHDHDHDHGDEGAASEDAHDHDHDHDHGEDGHDHSHDEESAEAGGHAHTDEAHDHAHDEETASEDGHDHGTFNEHVWYSVPTMEKYAADLAEQLSELDPEGKDDYTANAESFGEELHGLHEQIDAAKADHAGEKVAVTEPVPLYLFTDMGLENVVDEQFLAAVEHGSDVPPILLKDSLGLIESEDLALFGFNAQTSGPEAEELKANAEEKGVPVVELTETMPEGVEYAEWMGENITSVVDALDS